jgi:CheY-like chemotaxis protein
MMPGLTGLEVLERARGLPERAQLPVVILTAKGQDRDREAAFSLGANDFITKPFSPKKLLALIHQFVQLP